MKNWRTTLAAIVTALGLVPAAIASMNLEVVPDWLKTVGAVCTFIGIIATGLLAKDKNVTGVGDTAKTKAQIKSGQ
jgi:hypothetical protein